jgi:hypothetical protein
LKSKQKIPKKSAVNLNEPGTPYEQVKKSDPWKTITVSSLEEQEEATRIYSANLTPSKRLEVLQQLIQISFGQVLKQPVGKLWNKKIHITKGG